MYTALSKPFDGLTTDLQAPYHLVSSYRLHILCINATSFVVQRLVVHYENYTYDVPFKIHIIYWMHRETLRL